MRKQKKKKVNRKCSPKPAKIRPSVIEGTLNKPSRISGHIPINLKISLSSKDLDLLCVFLKTNPKECAKQLYELLWPHANKVPKSDIREFRFGIVKSIASRHYALFSLLCKKPFKECSDYFRDFLDYIYKLENKESFMVKDSFKKEERKFDLLVLTAYCVGNYNMEGEPLFSYGEKDFNSDSFYRTYVLPGLQQAKKEIEDIGIENLDRYTRIVDLDNILSWSSLINNLKLLSKGKKLPSELSICRDIPISRPIPSGTFIISK